MSVTRASLAARLLVAAGDEWHVTTRTTWLDTWHGRGVRIAAREPIDVAETRAQLPGGRRVACQPATRRRTWYKVADCSVRRLSPIGRVYLQPARRVTSSINCRPRRTRGPCAQSAFTSRPLIASHAVLYVSWCMAVSSPLNPGYTIQPVVRPVEERFNNRLYRVNGVLVLLSTGWVSAREFFLKNTVKSYAIVNQ